VLRAPRRRRARSRACPAARCARPAAAPCRGWALPLLLSWRRAPLSTPAVGARCSARTAVAAVRLGQRGMADALWTSEAAEWAKARPDVEANLRDHGPPGLGDHEAWAAGLRGKLSELRPPKLELDEAKKLVDW
jgi:hypothetical protein